MSNDNQEEIDIKIDFMTMDLEDPDTDEPFYYETQGDRLYAPLIREAECVFGRRDPFPYPVWKVMTRREWWKAFLDSLAADKASRSWHTPSNMYTTVLERISNWDRYLCPISHHAPVSKDDPIAHAEEIQELIKKAFGDKSPSDVGKFFKASLKFGKEIIIDFNEKNELEITFQKQHYRV